MATTSLWPIHNTGGRGVRSVVKKLVEYAENDEKTSDPKAESGKRTNSDTVRSVLGYVSKDQKVESKDNLAEPHGKEESDAMKPGKSGTPNDFLGPLDDAADDNEALQMIMGHMSDWRSGMRYVTGINCSPERAVDEMMITKNRWPERGNRLLYHGYQSFSPGEVTPDQAHKIGVQMARELWGDRFEIVVATHLDREHIHSHFVINTVSFLDGRKFIWDDEYPRMKKRSDELCRAAKLSVVEHAENSEIRFHKGSGRAEERGVQTVQSIVKSDIDNCIKASSTLEEWLSLMRGKGYQIDDSHKYLRIFPYGHSKCIRIDRRYGEEYTLDGIAAQIAQQKMGVERKEKTEEEAIQDIYRELSRSAKRRHMPLKRPRGMQVYYMRFLFRIGYHKSPAQIARTHYLLREELTKLDRYIEESKFLIYEDITTMEQLKDRRDQDQKEVNTLYRSKINLQRMLPHSSITEKENAMGQISKIEASIKKLRKNLKNEKAIMKRMGEMEQKEKTVDMVLSGKAVRNRVGHRQNLQVENGRGIQHG